MKPIDTIMLLSELTGQRIVVDLREEQSPSWDQVHIPTSQVHFKNEPLATTDTVLDALTVGSTSPPSMCVQVTPGAHIQYYDELVTISQVMTSPQFTKLVGGTTPRRDLLCLTRKRSMNTFELTVLEGVRGSSELPLVPFDSFPLAIITILPGFTSILPTEIANVRTLFRYSPTGEFVGKPVDTSADLLTILDPRLGMQVLVMDEGINYFWDGSKWRKVTGAKFDNTVFSIDIEQSVSDVILPWPLQSSAEIIVFRDGLMMTPDKDYSLRVGLSSMIRFNYAIAKDQRITVIRNPFLGAAYDPSSADNVFDVWDIYVDGLDGRDYQSGMSEVEAVQTLTKAFSLIPGVSKDFYRVHAKNLQKSQVVLNEETGLYTYGVLRGRIMAGLSVHVESAYMDDSIQYVANFIDCRSIYINDYTLRFPMNFIGCTVSVFDATLNANCYFGSTSVFFSRSVSTSSIAIFGGSVAYARNSTFSSLLVHSGGVVEGENLEITRLGCASGGYYNLKTSTILGANVEGGTLLFTTSTFSGEGRYSNCQLRLDSCSHVGTLLSKVPTHFCLTDGTVALFLNCTINHTTPYGIQAVGNCTVYLQSGTNIANATDHGVFLQYSSSIFSVGSVRILGNVGSGVRLDCGSYGDLKGTTGDQNGRYGVEATNFSYFYHIQVSLTGNLGQFYFFNPGADTVAVSPTDRFPGTLNQKLVAGQHVTLQAINVAPNNEVYKIDLDYASVYIPPRASVYSRTVPLAPGDTWSVRNKMSGPAILHSILAFYRQSSAGGKSVLTTSTYQSEFNEMDKLFGTEFTPTFLHLKYRSGVGYPNDTPYWIYSYRDGAASLSTYSLLTIETFHIDFIQPTGTYVKVGFSWDNANTFWKYSLAQQDWIPCTGGTVLGQLYLSDPADDVNGYPAEAWARLVELTQGNPIQTGVLLGTTIHASSPEVSGYRWGFIREGYRYPVRETQVDVRIYTEVIEILNIGSINLEPPLHAVFLPLTDNL